MLLLNISSTLELSGLYVCLGGLIKLLSAWEDIKDYWVVVYYGGSGPRQTLCESVLYKKSVYYRNTALSQLDNDMRPSLNKYLYISKGYYLEKMIISGIAML